MSIATKTTFGPAGWPPQAVEILMKMRADGASLMNISRALGITRSMVSGKVRRLNLPPIKTRTNMAEPTKKQKKSSPKPRPERKPPTPPLPTPVIIETLAPTEPVPLLKSRHWHCRAVLSERDEKGLAMFCGRTVTKRVTGAPASWCAEHYKIFMDLERMQRRHG